MSDGNPQRSPSLPEPVRQFLSAVLLLTRIPLTWQKFSQEPPNHANGLWAYPLVGLLVGIIAANVYWFAELLDLPDFIASILAITAMIAVTGAMHEDALADVADGFGGGRDKDHKLEIMKDSRIGVYGVIALVLALLLRIGIVTGMATGLAPVALILASTGSRYGILFVLAMLSPVRPDGLGATAGKPSARDYAIGGGVLLLLAILLVDLMGALLFVLTAGVVLAIFIWLARRQVGGYTGDVLGASQQLSEIAILLTLSAYWAGG